MAQGELRLGDAAAEFFHRPVQADRVFAEFPEDLVHFERGEDGFNEHRGPDRPTGDAQGLLRGNENVVPEPRFVPAPAWANKSKVQRRCESECGRRKSG